MEAEFVEIEFPEDGIKWKLILSSFQMYLIASPKIGLYVTIYLWMNHTMKKQICNFAFINVLVNALSSIFFIKISLRVSTCWLVILCWFMFMIISLLALWTSQTIHILVVFFIQISFQGSTCWLLCLFDANDRYQ